MAESLGTAALELEADDSKLGSQLDAAKSSAQQQLLETGKFVTKTVSVVAGALAAGATLAFNEWHQGFEAIRVGTGATGKELDGLVASMENVAGKVTAPISEVGTVMAELARRTGLTGPPLEELTTQFINLDELGMPASIDSVTQAFTLWNVATDDQAATLDELFRASQETGTAIDTITTALVKFAAPLQALGFTLPQSVALLASMSQHGVNTTKAVGGLTKAFATWAKEGKDPQVMLDRLIERIQNAKTIADATGIAVDVFGTKAGVDLAKAIRGGALSVDDLTKKIATGHDTIETARAATETWMDKLTILKNRVIAATGPYGQLVAVIATGVAAIGPMIVGVADLIPLLGKMGTALKIAGPVALVGLLAVGIAGVVVALRGVPSPTEAAANAIRDLNDQLDIFAARSGEVNASARELAHSRLDEKAATLALRDAQKQLNAVRKDEQSTHLQRQQAALAVKQAEQGVADAIHRRTSAEVANRAAQKKQADADRKSIGSLKGLIEQYRMTGRAVQRGFGDAEDATRKSAKALDNLKAELRNVQDGATQASPRVRDLAGRILDVIERTGKVPDNINIDALLRNYTPTKRGIEDLRAAALRAATNYTLDFYIRTHGSVNAPTGVDPHGASGGIVTRPIRALIGERGPEAVVPLNRMPGVSPLPRGAGGGGGLVKVIVVGGDRQAISYLQDLDNDHRRSNGGAGIFD